MERLSRAYPEITVRVNGDGEDSDDLDVYKRQCYRFVDINDVERTGNEIEANTLDVL